MHTDLQFDVIPALIEMFPNVQFIISTHSPLVALGIEYRLGNDKVAIIDMPSGEVITAERFTEFQRAMDVMRQTALFQSAISEQIILSEKNLVLLEGETDPEYFLQACAILQEFSEEEKKTLLHTDFEWIGAKQGSAGRNTFSGKDSLNQAYSFLKANTAFVKRKILFLYDCDAKKPSLDEGNLHVRCIASNPGNKKISIGVENLLPESVFSDDVFDTSKKVEPSGKSVEIRELNKMSLCKKICGRKEVSDFAGFLPALKEITNIFSLSSF